MIHNECERVVEVDDFASFCCSFVLKLEAVIFLLQNMDYILSTLELEKVTVRDVTEPGVEKNLVEMTYPGRPVIMYMSQRASELII